MSVQKFTASQKVKEQFDLKERVCIITGGAGFLGLQYAEAIAEMGGIPILFDVNKEHVEKGITHIRDNWGQADGQVVDITKNDNLKLAVSDVINQYGRIDILINNAALTKYGCDVDPELFYAPFQDTNRSVWELGLEVNLTGTALACQAIGPIMINQGKGTIINMGSDVGIISPDQRIYEPNQQGYEGQSFNTPAFYSVSKAGVIHLTKHLATIWGKDGVRVNAFSPAGVFRDHEEGFYKQLTSRIPMGRMGAINEYKGAIVFLASDASSFMTGHNLVIDGGRTAW
jgi:NAD(P)-dependent dehydrogenase (short-subunit alcohol dehydrogenase family)